MPELTQAERLQPSLLDRLTDDSPGQEQESRNERVISMQRLRHLVLRDLTWLLNSANVESVQPLDHVPYVADSVVNFGIRAVVGRTATTIDPNHVANWIRSAIERFEPRILRNTLRVDVATEERMDHNTVVMSIEGELWAQPVPLHLFMKTEIDLETGDVIISESVR